MTRTMSQAERQAWLDAARYTANPTAAALDTCASELLRPVETLQSDRFWERVHVQAGLPAPAIAYSGEVRA